VIAVWEGQNSCHLACLLPALTTSINVAIIDIKGTLLNVSRRGSTCSLHLKVKDVHIRINLPFLLFYIE
jgi:hypothetical protein